MKPMIAAQFKQRISKGLFYAAVMSTFVLAQTMTGCQGPIKPAEKQRAPATITPWSWSNEFKESDHLFDCADGVMIGIQHAGDENGPTRYRCGKVHQFVDLPPTERAWSGDVKESDHAYDCPPNMVMTARKHYGDENDGTWYECAILKDDWGNDIQVIPNERVDAGDYEGSNFECPANQVLTHRGHKGDTESGNVYYRCATLW